MQAHLIPSPLRAVLGLQRATCSMQLASCKPPTSDTQICNIQDATNMVVAMQHIFQIFPDVIVAMLLLLVVAGGLLLSRRDISTSRNMTTPRSGQLWLP
jgi:hypothetical protein